MKDRIKETTKDLKNTFQEIGKNQEIYHELLNKLPKEHSNALNLFLNEVQKSANDPKQVYKAFDEINAHFSKFKNDNNAGSKS